MRLKRPRPWWTQAPTLEYAVHMQRCAKRAQAVALAHESGNPDRVDRFSPCFRISAFAGTTDAKVVICHVGILKKRIEHNIPLITTVAAGFGMALILGFIAERLKVSALVGYLLARIVIGLATPGFVADVPIASQLSEIGVVLLIFGVGLHFSLKDLLAVRRIAIPGAVVQMSLATLLGMGLAWWWGWSWGAGLIFGLSLSCASTVVLLKALEARGVLDTMNGRIAVGWLVV